MQMWTTPVIASYSKSNHSTKRHSIKKHNSGGGLLWGNLIKNYFFIYIWIFRSIYAHTIGKKYCYNRIISWCTYCFQTLLERWTKNTNRFFWISALYERFNFGLYELIDIIQLWCYNVNTVLMVYLICTKKFTKNAR